MTQNGIHLLSSARPMIAPSKVAKWYGKRKAESKYTPNKIPTTVKALTRNALIFVSPTARFFLCLSDDPTHSIATPEFREEVFRTSDLNKRCFLQQKEPLRQHSTKSILSFLPASIPSQSLANPLGIPSGVLKDCENTGMVKA